MNGRDKNLEIITSEPLLKEVKQTLLYPKLFKLIKWDYEQVAQFIDLLYFYNSVIDITAIKTTGSKDHNDEKILSTFLKGEADYLITDDQDLLDLSDKYNIITPVEFINKFL